MERKLWISQYLKKLYDRMCEPIFKKYKLTKLEMDILAFLANNPHYNTAKDIIEIRMLSKSNVSTGLDSLIKRHFIVSCTSNTDRRIQHLFVEESSKEMIAEIKQMQYQYKCVIEKGFSEDEKKVMENIFQKMTNNIEDKLKEIEDAK